jgi:hypothetical protein
VTPVLIMRITSASLVFIGVLCLLFRAIHLAVLFEALAVIVFFASAERLDKKVIEEIEKYANER